MTKLLAFDTSTEACSAALLVDGKVSERFEIAPRRHSDLLLQMVDELLTDQQLKLSDLDALAVGCGPGSFMGVRLAIGVAQGLAFGAKLPVIPVSSLQALAQYGFVKLQQKHILAAWDARMGEIYWGAYVHSDDGIMMVADCDHISLPQAISVAKDKAWTLVGNAWQHYQDDLPPDLQLDSHLYYPHAVSMLELSEFYLAKGEVLTAEQLEPNYLRHNVANKK